MLPVIKFQFHYLELTPDDSTIPEEKETMEAIKDCLEHVFQDFNSSRYKKPVDILVKGNYLDFEFIAEVHNKKDLKTAERLFVDLNSKLAAI